MTQNPEQLRAVYRPETVGVLFVGESAPAATNGPLRFFYSPALSQHDNLFRGIMLALYDARAGDLRGRKLEWLDRFQSDRYWLLDLVDHPINDLPESERRPARARSVAESAPRLAPLAQARPPPQAQGARWRSHGEGKPAGQKSPGFVWCAAVCPVVQYDLAAGPPLGDVVNNYLGAFPY